MLREKFELHRKLTRYRLPHWQWTFIYTNMDIKKSTLRHTHTYTNREKKKEIDTETDNTVGVMPQQKQRLYYN